MPVARTTATVASEIAAAPNFLIAASSVRAAGYYHCDRIIDIMNPQRPAQLDDTSVAVLGLIALRGPSTAYEIKRALSRIANEYWPLPHVTSYRVTSKLESQALLVAKQEPGGRRRRVYSLTEAGRGALQEWVSEPTAET